MSKRAEIQGTAPARPRSSSPAQRAPPYRTIHASSLVSQPPSRVQYGDALARRRSNIPTTSQRARNIRFSVPKASYEPLFPNPLFLLPLPLPQPNLDKLSSGLPHGPNSLCSRPFPHRRVNRLFEWNRETAGERYSASCLVRFPRRKCLAGR